MTPNLRAFLSTIAICEVGTAGPESYTVLYGGSHFSGFADHPRRKITAGKYTSTAAGRYQALAGTWDDFCRAKGKHDFSPASQDEFAVWCITRRKALDDVEAGRIPEAIARCGKEWASLPGSPYGQPVRTLAECLGYYKAAGGSLSTGLQPATPVITRKADPMGATLLAGLIPSILSLFSDRAQAAITKATGASPDVAAKFTQDLAAQIEQVSGVAVTDPATAMQAAAAVASDPVKVAALEQHSTNFVLTEMGGGIKGAQEEYAAINRDYDDDAWWRIVMKFLFNPVHWVTGVFLWYVQQFIPALADKVKALDGAAAMGLIVIVFGVIALVGSRWLGAYVKTKE